MDSRVNLEFLVPLGLWVRRVFRVWLDRSDPTVRWVSKDPKDHPEPA